MFSRSKLRIQRYSGYSNLSTKPYLGSLHTLHGIINRYSLRLHPLACRGIHHIKLAEGNIDTHAP
jgi:hypothetical protein